jgi:hypothetical protein
VLAGRTFELLQLRVLRPDFFQDGDAGVGVSPEGEEILMDAWAFVVSLVVALTALVTEK